MYNDEQREKFILMDKNDQIKKFKGVLIICILTIIALGCILFIEFGIANDQMEIALPSLIIAVVLSIITWANYIIAHYFYNVAVNKGYSEILYLKLAFFVPLAGYLLVIALPNKKQ